VKSVIAMSVGKKRLGLMILLLGAVAVGTAAVAQTSPVKMFLRGSEPIEPVMGDSILGHFQASEGSRGVVRFYPVAGTNTTIWSGFLPPLPNATLVDIFILPGSFSDLSGNLNEEVIRDRFTVQNDSLARGQQDTRSFWQVH